MRGLRRTLIGGCNCAADATITRRSLLAGGGAALGVGSVIGPHALAQAKPHRIDVHHHVSPPSWVAAMQKAGIPHNPPRDDWSVAKSLEDMDQGGTATAIVSPQTPQLNFLANDKDTAARVARESNEYTKKLMADHPGRFGLFAMLPLPHIDASLNEIAYAFDALHADGIGVMTNYGDKWLGYAYFAPIWEELNRRKATVYTHPTTANCCLNLVQGVPESAIEWGTDTARSITNLIFSGTSQRYKDIDWIFSHGGGVLTAVAERLQMQMVRTPPHKDKFTRAIVDGELARFHYDTAQVSNAVTIGALAKLVPVSQIVFGTDYPYRTTLEHAKGLAAAFSGAELQAIERGNALRLIPRLRQA